MIVLDSSFLVAWLNERDAHHRAALSAMERLATGAWGEALLPEYVFLETATVLASRRGLQFAAEHSKAILEAREAEFVHCSPYFAAALDLFRTQRRTKMSFSDCAILAIARERGATAVASFDRDFGKVEGLTVVPP